MRWYFALDEGGAEGGLGTMAKLAVLSARAVGGLEPIMLYHGAPGELTAWMQRQHVRVVPTRPSFWDIMERAKAALLAIPLILMLAVLRPRLGGRR